MILPRYVMLTVISQTERKLTRLFELGPEDLRKQIVGKLINPMLREWEEGDRTSRAALSRKLVTRDAPRKVRVVDMSMYEFQEADELKHVLGDCVAMFLSGPKSAGPHIMGSLRSLRYNFSR